MDSYDKAISTATETGLYAHFKVMLDERIDEFDRPAVIEYYLFNIHPFDFECDDNYRICYITDIDWYKKMESRGCCGTYDVSFRVPSGKIVLFGFNYGH